MKVAIAVLASAVVIAFLLYPSEVYYVDVDYCATAFQRGGVSSISFDSVRVHSGIEGRSVLSSFASSLSGAVGDSVALEIETTHGVVSTSVPLGLKGTSTQVLYGSFRLYGCNKNPYGESFRLLNATFRGTEIAGKPFEMITLNDDGSLSYPSQQPSALYPKEIRMVQGDYISFEIYPCGWKSLSVKTRPDRLYLSCPMPVSDGSSPFVIVVGATDEVPAGKYPIVFEVSNGGNYHTFQTEVALFPQEYATSGASPVTISVVASSTRVSVGEPVTFTGKITTYDGKKLSGERYLRFKMGSTLASETILKVRVVDGEFSLTYPMTFSGSLVYSFWFDGDGKYLPASSQPLTITAESGSAVMLDLYGFLAENGVRKPFPIQVEITRYGTTDVAFRGVISERGLTTLLLKEGSYTIRASIPESLVPNTQPKQIERSVTLMYPFTAVFEFSTED